MDQDDGSTRASVHRIFTPDRPSVTGIEEIAVPGERYQIGDMLGRGGMGEVVEAEDAQIGRVVAIKRMRAESPSTKQIARFMREARIQGRLEHPAIVPVHELGRDAAGRPYFAMKKLSGTTLAAILKNGQTTKVPRQRLLRALAVSASPSSSRTPAGSSTATSSPTTSCSATSARPTCSTGASPRSPARKTPRHRPSTTPTSSPPPAS